MATTIITKEIQVASAGRRADFVRIDVKKIKDIEEIKDHNSTHYGHVRIDVTGLARPVYSSEPLVAVLDAYRKAVDS